MRTKSSPRNTTVPPQSKTTGLKRHLASLGQHTWPVILCCAAAGAAHAQSTASPQFPASPTQAKLALTAESTLADSTREFAPAYSSSLANASAPNSADPQPGLPEAPNPQGQQTGERAPSSKRILGIIPNFRTVSTDQHLPPQTVKQKFVTATQDSFDYSSIFIPAVVAGYSLGTNADPEFGHGGVGYGRYLWHAVVDQTSENYLVEAIVPSITHEDSRFYTLARGSATKRAGYALSRVVITRSDSGKQVFNASEIFGSGISAGLSSLYYPSRERSFGNTSKQWGLDIGIDAISFGFKEFWPDVNQRLFGKPKSNNP